MTDKLVILAAGASSRMKAQMADDNALSPDEREQANTRSKGLISLDKSGRPLLDYLLYHAQLAGYKTVYLITGKDNFLFKQFYGEKHRDNNFKGLKIHYVIQHIPEGREKPYGTADALYQAFEQYPDLQSSSFAVCNSDNLYSVKALELLRAHKVSPNAVLSYNRESLQFPEARISRFALMQFDKEGFLIDILEKPDLLQVEKFTDSSGKLRVSMNIFKFDGNLFFKFIKECPVNAKRNEKEIPSALLNMVKQYPKSVRGVPISEHVPDLTSKEDITALKTYVEKIDLNSWV